MIRIVRNVSTPQMPLAAYEEFGAFKLYAHDVGLVGAMADVPQQILLEGDSLFTHFKGALTEQYVLEELTALGVSPNYWSPDNIKAEVEFLMSVAENPAISAELKDTIKAAIENYIKANNAPMEMLEKRFMKMAKTDEEKEFVRQMMDEVKKEE